jgi:hypothetical protein
MLRLDLVDEDDLGGRMVSQLVTLVARPEKGGTAA